MEIRKLETEAERETAVPVLRQLWTDRDPDEVLAWTGEDDYHLFAAYDPNAGTVDTDHETPVGVAGVLVAGLLHHARHAWLYDLVVDEPRRGEGAGTALVDHVETWARERDCESVALASPLAKADTHAFYETQDYERWGYVIERDLAEST